jgi:cytosine/adenosine deaminase-related metal-dependent hydrolase
MAMGHPVAVRAGEKGARASLGIDIVSNYSGDMFAQMRLLLQAQRGLENGRLTAPPRRIRYRAEEVLRLATLGGARALGMDGRIGSLTPGKRADVVVTRCDAINLVPVHDPVGALVMNANTFNVDTVLVNGRPVKRGGQLVGVDWPALAARLRRSAERIVTQARAIPVAVIEELAAPLMLREG